MSVEDPGILNSKRIIVERAGNKSGVLMTKAKVHAGQEPELTAALIAKFKKQFLERQREGPCAHTLMQCCQCHEQYYVVWQFIPKKTGARKQRR